MSEENKDLFFNIDEKTPEDDSEYGVLSEEDNTAIEMKPEERKNITKEIYEWISSIAMAVVLAFVINTFFFSLVQVDGSSMVPTLHHGERLIVRKFAYTPQGEDIVIVKSSPLEKFIVKRVLALPSQTVEFSDELDLVVDGELIAEDYIEAKQISTGYLYNYPITVPKKGEKAELSVILAEQACRPDKVLLEQKNGNLYITGSSFVKDGEFLIGETTYKSDGYFVLGDNRNNSADSRVFGFVPEKEIIGEAIIRFYPFNSIGLIK